MTNQAQPISRNGKSRLLGGLAVLLGGLQAVNGAEPPDATEVEEIIVTAQKREQSLSDVSLSVAAIVTNDLVNSQSNSHESLHQLVPSISIGSDVNIAKLFIGAIRL